MNGTLECDICFKSRKMPSLLDGERRSDVIADASKDLKIHCEVPKRDCGSASPDPGLVEA